MFKKNFCASKKKTRRRTLMLEIARRIIASKGLRSLKVRDVAEAADCSIGSVYNEFGDFDGLILTVNRETVRALTVRLRAVAAEDAIRRAPWPCGDLSGVRVGARKPSQIAVRTSDGGRRPFPEDILIMVMQAFALMHDPLGSADA